MSEAKICSLCPYNRCVYCNSLRDVKYIAKICADCDYARDKCVRCNFFGATNTAYVCKSCFNPRFSCINCRKYR